jgi:TatA/E family protein of Tat protein translocase
MFGSIGFPELIMIFIVVLLVFGPKKLPEFAKLLGKTVREFRSTIDQAKASIEDELYKEGINTGVQGLGKELKDIKDALNVYSDIDKPIRDIGRDVADALNGKGEAAQASSENKKGRDDEKSE